MTYKDTLDWMFEQLPMYQRQGKTAYKKDLSNTLKLAKYLKHPETKFKSVHVAGTNGKGSTSHMIASILQEAGYKIGLYTSPHLKDFRERIKINGKPISKQFVMGFVEKRQDFFRQEQLSFFEMTVGMAFDYFSKKKIDIAVVEVGMGGRLDSTNIINPEVSVITNIGLDHTQFLGDTLELIAAEKAGIIKEGIPVVIGETQAETKPVFDEIAGKHSAEIIYADSEVKQVFESDLKGSYQAKNIKTAIQTIQTIQTLKGKGFKVSSNHIKKGFLNVIKNTGLLGRWQILRDHPKVICDTGHNREGLQYNTDQLAKETYDNLHIVFGVVNDKDLGTIIDILPKQARYYFCKPNIPRGKNANDLKREFAKYGVLGEAYHSTNEAYKAALKEASKTDVIYVGGSTFVVAEII